MLKLGEINKLIAINKTEHGIYFAESRESNEKVLLPIGEIRDEPIKTGQHLDLFIYKDSSDRPVATLLTPKIQLHQVKLLKINDVAKIGAFVDWGLKKDLLLPFKEQTKKVNKSEDVLVALYIDKTGRLCLTMNVYDYLDTDHNYKTGDDVHGRVYLISERFGAFVAVDDTYSALIPQKELYGNIKVGDIVDARITKVQEDGKLSLSIRKKSYLQIDDDAEKIIKVIGEFDGVLPFNDKADPEVIKREFNMSKNEFKRAVGKLYKERKIEITDHSIRLLTR